jgi:hypothetical protein
MVPRMNIAHCGCPHNYWQYPIHLYLKIFKEQPKYADYVLFEIKMDL